MKHKQIPREKLEPTSRWTHNIAILCSFPRGIYKKNRTQMMTSELQRGVAAQPVSRVQPCSSDSLGLLSFLRAACAEGRADWSSAFVPGRGSLLRCLASSTHRHSMSHQKEKEEKDKTPTSAGFQVPKRFSQRWQRDLILHYPWRLQNLSS